MTLILDSWSMQSFTQRHFFSEAMDKERENMIWTSDVRQTGYGHTERGTLRMLLMRILIIYFTNGIINTKVSNKIEFYS